MSRLRLSLRRFRGAFWIALLLGNLGLIAVLGAGFPGATSAHATGPGMSAMPGMAGMQIAMARAATVKVVTTTMLHHKVVHITIHNFAFSPARLVVSPGTKIIWTNTDSDPHTVDSTRNIWSSEALDTDSTFSRVFKQAGAFPYYCSIHPFMRATIIVTG
jgi:plastocyanin